MVCGTYNVCGEGILYSVIFYHLLIHQWQSSPDIRQHGNLWLGLLGLQGINWSIDHIRVKLLFVTEFIYTFTSCQKKYQALSYLCWFFHQNPQVLTGDHIFMIQHHI